MCTTRGISFDVVPISPTLLQHLFTSVRLLLLRGSIIPDNQFGAVAVVMHAAITLGF